MSLSEAKFFRTLDLHRLLACKDCRNLKEKDNFGLQVWVLQVLSDAFRVNERSRDVQSGDGRGYSRFFIRYDVFG